MKHLKKFNEKYEEEIMSMGNSWRSGDAAIYDDAEELRNKLEKISELEIAEFTHELKKLKPNLNLKEPTLKKIYWEYLEKWNHKLRDHLSKFEGDIREEEKRIGAEIRSGNRN